jgi:gliding motility-associated-like protein
MKLNGLTFAVFLLQFCAMGQRKFDLVSSFFPVQCEKGLYTLQVMVEGAAAGETLQVQPSIGKSYEGPINGGYTFKVANADSGEYNVSIHLFYRDSLLRHIDTNVVFYIPKLQCGISIAKYFSPNDDGVNDRLLITNIEKFPDFELHIFNKWGQRVHFQQGTYTPWDGRWSGIELPDGAYYFVFFYQASNKLRIEKGDITILR